MTNRSKEALNPLTATVREQVPTPESDWRRGDAVVTVWVFLCIPSLTVWGMQLLALGWAWSAGHWFFGAMYFIQFIGTPIAAWLVLKTIRTLAEKTDASMPRRGWILVTFVLWCLMHLALLHVGLWAAAWAWLLLWSRFVAEQGRQAGGPAVNLDGDDSSGKFDG